MGIVRRLKKGMVQAVTTLLVFIVGIMLGAIIIGKIQDVANTLNIPENVKNVIDALFTQTWGAYGLLVVMPIIVVAAIVIGLLGFGGPKRR